MVENAVFCDFAKIFSQKSQFARLIAICYISTKYYSILLSLSMIKRMKRFQEALIEQRKLNRLTQREVAKRLGISQPSYIRYENGKAEPSLENLVKLADLFDVSVDYLLGRTDY